MKHLLYLFIFIPSICIGQESRNEPFKGATTMHVTYTVSGDTLFSKLVSDLTEYGFTVDKKDKEVLLITTEDKTIKHVSYNMRIVVKGSVAKFSSRFKSNVTMSFGGAKIEQTYYPTEYAKSKMNVQWDIYNDLTKFIQKTVPQGIVYTKD